MRSYLRAEFARAAYADAILAIRAEPTASRWARLLRAQTNLKQAEREWDRDRVSGGWRGRASLPRPPLVHRAARTPGGPPSPPAAPSARSGWAELEAAIARARVLIAESRRLVAKAREVTGELEDFETVSP